MPHKGYKQTQEHRDKSAVSRLGKPLRDDQRAALIASGRLGHPMGHENKLKLIAAHTGLHPSDDTRAKMSASHVGKKLSPETCAKRSATRRLHPPLLTDESRLKMSVARRCIKYSPETIHKMSIAKTGKKYGIATRMKCSLSHQGEKSYLWRGGLSFGKYCKLFNDELRKRIRAFYEHRCILCGKHESEIRFKLSCHHVTYNKAMCCDDNQVRFAAMCHKHHMITNFNRDQWEYILNYIIDEIYGGKSYYTKEEMLKMCDY